MGFMDKVKETAAKGTEMAKGAAKAGQDKLDEQKTKKKIGDLKEELGGIVYAQRTGSGTGSADAEIGRLVSEIKDAEEELAAIRAAADDADVTSGDTPTTATTATTPTTPTTATPPTTPTAATDASEPAAP